MKTKEAANRGDYHSQRQWIDGGQKSVEQALGESHLTTKIQPYSIAAHTKIAVMSWRFVRAFCMALISRSKPYAGSNYGRAN